MSDGPADEPDPQKERERERKALTGVEGEEPLVSDRVLSSERAPMSFEMVERRPLAAAVGSGASRRIGRADAVSSPGAIDDPDRDLVARWQKGDASAFEQLVRRHEKKVFRLLLRMMGSREEAQDVAQETFLSLHRHGHRFRGDARFSTFIYRVASNAALNRRRTLGRNRARIQKLAVRQAAGDDLPTSPRNPEDAMIGGDLSIHVRRALDGLKPALRLPVVLYDIEGLAYGEIAQVMGVAEGTVKSRIHRARQALRIELKGLIADAPGVPDNSGRSKQ
jgi:RNA polymerase sigma-70 factor (ECF subfamily)